MRDYVTNGQAIAEAQLALQEATGQNRAFPSHTDWCIVMGMRSASDACCWVACLMLLNILGVSTARASDPVISFRNGGTGAYPDADPPLEWSTTRNVRWRWKAPAKTISSPIIVGGRVITVADPMTVACVDKDTGEERWRRTTWMDVAEAEGPTGHMHEQLRHYSRIKALQSMLDPRGLEKKLRNLRRKSEKLPEDRRGGYVEEIAATEALLATHRANREQYERELAEIETAIPSVSGKPLKPCGYLTAASPASDGKRIFAVFSPGLVVCCDLDGQLLWVHAVLSRRGSLAKPSWGSYAAVPICVDGALSSDGSAPASKVVVTWGNLLRCLDAATGEVLWQHDGIRGALCAAAPAIGAVAGEAFIAMANGEVRALADGKVAFTRKTTEHRAYCAGAVSADGRTFHYTTFALQLTDDPAARVAEAWQLAPAYRLQGQKNGGAKPATDWAFGGSHQYCAPVVHDGLLYAVCTHSTERLM